MSKESVSLGVFPFGAWRRYSFTPKLLRDIPKKIRPVRLPDGVWPRSGLLSIAVVSEGPADRRAGDKGTHPEGCAPATDGGLLQSPFYPLYYANRGCALRTHGYWQETVLPSFQPYRSKFFRFFPLKMSYIAEQCVVMSWLVRELGSQAQSHDSAT